MAELIKLRRQIKSINTNRKITNAMRLISMSLYSKLEKTNQVATSYKNYVEQIFTKLIQSNPTWESPLINPQDPLDTNPLFIFVASTKGFCGAFNNELIQYFRRNFFIEGHQHPQFITVGKKANEYIKSKKFGNIINNFSELNSENYITITDAIMKLITSPDNNYSSINVYNNTFVNFFVHKPQKNILIPLNLKTLSISNEKNQSEDTEDLIWEGDKSQIMSHLATKYLRTKILNILFQSLLAEQSARFIAMDGATTNADKILEKLNREYNKSRQANITKELLELSSSFSEN